MQHQATLCEGPRVSLEALLAAREQRVARRSAALSVKDGMAAISVTPVMPGPIKDCSLSRLIQSAALASLEQNFRENAWDFELVYAETEATGPEALFTVAAPSVMVKGAMVRLEKGHPLGRLWDMDVVGTDLKAVSRADLGLPPRRCLICGAPARLCARSRAHSPEVLMGEVRRRVDAWIFRQ